ncbi:TNT domain-containing protein, partial [Mesorhizobium japonicum]|uniref:TNT domain-containing protein n=1 Tax=Mesorhizobium japonicum TaxID=2066070 RepID=UPI003B59928C
IAEQIANLVGDLWPDGDTGKLDDASRVWHAFADDLDHVAATLTSASRALDGVDTPELPRVHDTISRIRNFATDLAGAARNLGKSCNTLSGKIAYVHTQTEITLAITIAAIAATVAAALGGTVFTFGASDAIGAAAAAGETAGAVATITGFISELAATISSLVGGITATTAGLFGAADAATIIGTTAGDLTATAVLWGTAGAAENTIVTAITEPDNDLLDAATDGFISWSLGSALGTTLELGATTTKLEPATTRELLSDEPTEQFLRKWSKGPGDHGPDWIWPPNHGFDGISRPNALTPGERIDRITATRPDGQLADGDFASPKGRPFPERSLPPDRLRPPFVTVTYEVLKPLPPEVLEGRVASWLD